VLRRSTAMEQIKGVRANGLGAVKDECGGLDRGTKVSEWNWTVDTWQHEDIA
jgi:hypothetical protein